MSEQLLWTTVMNSVIKELGEGQRKRWKVAGPNESLCAMCEDNGGVLMKCAHEKCSTYFHMDCAMNHGGISLMDNGLLICECDNHYKEIIFCSCKQKYDGSKAMIFCDECCDWYHLTCEHISSAQQHLDRYTCRSCLDLLNHGKTVSKAVKDKNLEKEFRSTCNQNALRVLGHINELAVVVCPIIDSLSAVNDESIDISELNNTIEYLSTPPYSPAQPSTSSENGSDENEDSHFLKLFGVQDLVQEWLKKCHEAKSAWEKWIASIEVFTSQIMSELSYGNFQHEIISVIQTHFEQFKEIELNRPTTISTFDGFLSIGDCLKWILDFTQSIHNQVQVEFWTQHLTTMIRAVQAKVKKALSLTKEDQFFINFAKWFQGYANSASEFVGRISNWCRSVLKIFRQEVDCSLPEAEQLFKEAQEFPVQFQLIEDLKGLIEKAHKLDHDVEKLLLLPSIEEADLERLNEEKSSVCLLLPHEDSLTELSRKLIFLKAYQLASSEERLQLEIAQTLLEEAKSVLNETNDMSSMPLLLENLDKQVKAIIEKVESLIATTNEQLQSLHLDVSTRYLNFQFVPPSGLQGLTIPSLSSTDYTADLEKLKTLPLITKEEELLRFLLNLEEVFQRSQVLLEDHIKTSSEELEELVSSLSNAHSNSLLDSYAQGTERKGKIRRILSALLDLQSSGQKSWNNLLGAFEDLRCGISITEENFLLFLTTARDSIIAHPEIEQEAQDLLAKAREFTNEAQEKLKTVHDFTAESLEIITNLLEGVKHYPIDAVLANKIRKKQELMKTILAAKEALQQHQQQQMLSPEEIDEKSLLPLREIKNHLLKISTTAQDLEISDQTAFQEMEAAFYPLQWKLEIQYLFAKDHQIALHHAEKLKQFGEKISASTVCESEWTLLLRELDRLQQLNHKVSEFTSQMESLMDGFSQEERMEITAPSSANFSPLQEELYPISEQLQLWMKKIETPLRDFQQLSQEIVALHILDEELQQKRQELLTVFEIFETSQQLTSSLLSLHTNDANSGTSSTASSSSLVELKEIITILNKCALVSAPFNRFALMEGIDAALKQLYAEASAWVDRNQSLLPQKLTRLKNKQDLRLPSPQEIVVALQQPVAQLIKTPLHDRFYAAMSEAHLFRLKLLEILQCEQATGRDEEEENKNVKGSKGSEKEVDQILSEKINELSDLKTTAEMIPIDMPESLVLQWATDIFHWLKNIPHPGDDPEDSSITMDAARKQLMEANPLIQELPPKLVMALSEIGMMNLEEAKGPVGFHPQTFRYLKKSADYYEFLEQEIEKATEFEDSLQEAIEKDAQRISPKAYLEKYNALLVQPDGQIKKLLEKMLSTKSNEVEHLRKVSSVVTKSGRASRKRYADDFIFEDQLFDGSEGAVERSSAAVEKTKATPEVEIVGEVSTGKEKESRKKKMRPKCASCARELKSTQSSSFCSSKCAFKVAPELCTALIRIKQVFSAGSTALGDIDLKKDFEALSLSETEKEKEETYSSVHKNQELKRLLDHLPAVAKKVFLVEHSQEKKQMDIDQGLRSKAQAIIEDIFMAALLKQKVSGAVFLGAFLGQEVEEALYVRYLKSGNFDRKEYRKHSQMLMHNLRQPHNEALIVRLSKTEVSVEQLLNLTPQQLADSSLQEMRQKQFTAAVEDVQRKSTEEELEAKRREVMAGRSESWRDRVSTTEDEQLASAVEAAATKKTPALKDLGRVSSTDSATSEIEMLDSGSGGMHPDLSSSRDGEEAVSSMDGATSRSLQIEQRILLASQNPKQETARPAKRPLDADAMTRLTTTSSNRPQKLPKLSDIEENAEDVASNTSTSSPSPKVSRIPSSESPRMKAPSLLEVLKSNFSKSQDTEESMATSAAANHSVPPEMKKDHLGKYSQMPSNLKSSKPESKHSSSSSSSSAKTFEPSASYLPLMRLLNNEGSEGMTISRVKDINIRVTAMTNDKRVQGCLKTAINIDGRTKLPELQRFITEVLDQRKKIVASVVFLAFDVSPDEKDVHNGYQRFVTEFTRDQRASISNISDKIQLYVIPPQVKDSISILKAVTLDTKDLPTNQGVLYGLIVAKEAGPNHLVNKPHPILGFNVNSFSVLSTPVARAAIPQISPRPGGHLSNGGKISGGAGSHFFPPTATAAGAGRSNAFDSLASKPPMMGGPAQTGAPVTAALDNTGATVLVDKDKIRQVAEFCAKKGVAKLKSLQDNPESKTLMPFLFEGNAGYEEFMTTLKSLVGLNAMPVPASPLQQMSSTAVPGGSLYHSSRMMGQQPPVFNQSFPPESNPLQPPPFSQSSHSRRPNSRFN